METKETSYLSIGVANIEKETIEELMKAIPSTLQVIHDIIAWSPDPSNPEQKKSWQQTTSCLADISNQSLSDASEVNQFFDWQERIAMALQEFEESFQNCQGSPVSSFNSYFPRLKQSIDLSLEFLTNLEKTWSINFRKNKKYFKALLTVVGASTLKERELEIERQEKLRQETEDVIENLKREFNDEKEGFQRDLLETRINLREKNYSSICKRLEELKNEQSNTISKLGSTNANHSYHLLSKIHGVSVSLQKHLLNLTTRKNRCKLLTKLLHDTVENMQNAINYDVGEQELFDEDFSQEDIISWARNTYEYYPRIVHKIQEFGLTAPYLKETVGDAGFLRDRLGLTQEPMRKVWNEKWTREPKIKRQRRNDELRKEAIIRYTCDLKRALLWNNATKSQENFNDSLKKLEISENLKAEIQQEMNHQTKALEAKLQKKFDEIKEINNECSVEVLIKLVSSLNADLKKVKEESQVARNEFNKTLENNKKEIFDKLKQEFEKKLKDERTIHEKTLKDFKKDLQLRLKENEDLKKEIIVMKNLVNNEQKEREKVKQELKASLNEIKNDFEKRLKDERTIQEKTLKDLKTDLQLRVKENEDLKKEIIVMKKLVNNEQKEREKVINELKLRMEKENKTKGNQSVQESNSFLGFLGLGKSNQRTINGELEGILNKKKENNSSYTSTPSALVQKPQNQTNFSQNESTKSLKKHETSNIADADRNLLSGCSKVQNMQIFARKKKYLIVNILKNKDFTSRTIREISYFLPETEFSKEVHDGNEDYSADFNEISEYINPRETHMQIFTQVRL
jgi:hypothetical protein